ncbi:MAG: DUF934 domain-containing protein [Gammaproteobacteria bacterium]|nr:DUF934 domain-containing protein [Gammaproteobacteria bacterium]MDP2349221.1 DUF934 domain-containing protein [Gammaproteobacteria bacterium]
MLKLIKNRKIIDDQWTLVRDLMEQAEALSSAELNLIVPLPYWLENRDALQQRSGKSAVWLDSHEIPSALGDDWNILELIALNFPVFTDGRAYSSARELRLNLGFKGEIRAIGDVLRDQLFYMSRCGFDAFTMRADQNLESALGAFEDFNDGYQVSADKPLPLFRRRA